MTGNGVRMRDAENLSEPDREIWADASEKEAQIPNEVNQDAALQNHQEPTKDKAVRPKEQDDRKDNSKEMEASGPQDDMDKISNPEEIQELVKEYDKGGVFRKLAMLRYIKKHQAKPSDQAAKADYPGKQPEIKTDLVDKFAELHPRYTNIYETNKADLESTGIYKCIYKAQLRNQIELIVKIEEFPSNNTLRLDGLRREYYIGHTLGGMSEYIAQTYDSREIQLANNRTRFELLMECCGCSLLQCKDIMNDNGVMIVAYQLSNVMAFLEEHGVAHLDLKDANILWDSATSKIKLIDFGTSLAFYSTPHRILEPIGEDIQKIREYTKYHHSRRYSPLPRTSEMCDPKLNP